MHRVLVSLSSAFAAMSLVLAVGGTVPRANAAEYPVKGKALSVIVTQEAGGGNDLLARALTPQMAKDLEIPVQVINKVGAGGQIGFTELARAKPDGYTLGLTFLPGLVTIYLDPDRKAVFGRGNFQPVALLTLDPGVVAVRADSPYKGMKDLMDAAKANPEKIKVGDAGILAANHLPILELHRKAGVKFAIVHFTGGAPMLTAVMGGHIDAAFTFAPDAMSHFKGGNIRLLAVNDSQESKFYPGVKTMESQGYKLYFASARGISAPGGTPLEIVEKLTRIIKKTMEASEFKNQLDSLAFTPRYMSPEGFANLWTQVEAETKPLIPLARQ